MAIDVAIPQTRRSKIVEMINVAVGEDAHERQLMHTR